MKTGKHAVSFLRKITLAVALSLAPAATLWADPPKAAAPPPPSMAGVQSAYGHLPLSFEANKGQTDPHVQFLTRGRGHQLFLTPSEAALALRTSEAKGEGREGEAYQGKPSSSPPATSNSVVRMKFDGANPHAKMVGLDKLPGIVNYFIGADPSTWHTNIPTYKKVEYKNVYSGIDVVYYGNQGQLEYDLIVAPGANPNHITLAFEGTDQIDVDENGDLVLTVPRSLTDAAPGGAAALRLQKPVVYQMGDHGDKHLLAGTYVLLASETSPPRPASAVLHPRETPHPSPLTPHVAFQVASYDASKPLIIDPVLSWATYLGGSGTDTPPGRIAVDTACTAYVTGYTDTPGSGFPGTAGSLIQSTSGGGFDAFVAKITTNVPFAAFDPKVNITLGPLTNDDDFTVNATLTLGTSSDGIAPLTEAVTIQVGSFSATIPAGSFKLKPAKKNKPEEFTFAGIIDGVALDAKITPLGANSFEFKAVGNGVNLTGTVNPVTVGLTICNDQGSVAVTAIFQ